MNEVFFIKLEYYYVFQGFLFSLKHEKWSETWSVKTKVIPKRNEG